MATKPQALSSGRPQRVELFANRSGGVADLFDCVHQLILGYAEMPRPIFNVVVMLNSDFVAVESDCLTDHVSRA